MAWVHARKRELIALPLLCLCGLLAIVDFCFLGIAIGFGPDGFGGDGTVSRNRATVEHSGILAGFLGLAVAVVAVVAFLVLARHRRRNRVLAWLVAVQGLMLVLLLISGL